MFTSLAYVHGFDWLAVFEVLCVRKVSLISSETFIPKGQKRYVIKKKCFMCRGHMKCQLISSNIELDSVYF